VPRRFGAIIQKEKYEKKYIHVLFFIADFAKGKTAISCILHDR